VLLWVRIFIQDLHTFSYLRRFFFLWDRGMCPPTKCPAGWYACTTFRKKSKCSKFTQQHTDRAQYVDFSTFSRVSHISILKLREPPKTYNQMIQSDQTLRDISENSYLALNGLHRAEISDLEPGTHDFFTVFPPVWNQGPQNGQHLANLNMTTNQLLFPTKFCILNDTSANSLHLDWVEHVSSCSAFLPFFSRESSIKSRLVLHTVTNFPAWDSRLTISNTTWSTIKIYICNHTMASYALQYPTGNGSLYIDSENSIFS
jgi:hypothetical protein